MRILLINPNTSEHTTQMMTAIAQEIAPTEVDVVGVTAGRGVPMILDEDQLIAAGDGVIELARAEKGDLSGIIVSAFGDPALAELRGLFAIPVAGIFEASVLEASAGHRRFGIATVTPGLVDVLARRARALGLGDLFTGTRLTGGDPMALAGDPARLEAALAEAVERCFAEDGAEAVIIGGGPLGRAATDLARHFSAPVIAPIPAAVRQVLRDLGLDP